MWSASTSGPACDREGPELEPVARHLAGSWFRIVWTALLCLVPGLGHVYARAWGVGALLLALNLAWSFGLQQITARLPPTSMTLCILFGLLAVSLVVAACIAVDAVRRTRTAPTRPRPRWFQSTWVAAIVALGLGEFAVQPFGWRSFSIPSGSMIPALEVGDVMMVSTTVPFEALQRGDVIVFSLPGKPEIDYVKRVLGLPGDRIAMQDGTVVLNGTPLVLRPNGQMLAVDHDTRVLSRRMIETLPGDRFYPVLKLTNTGFANTMAEVTVMQDHLFVMGDNRDNSADSRFPRQLGQVPKANLVGRAGVLFWSADHARILRAVE